ncbi:beta-carotene 3-hydroxylase [Salvia divinorum]|uniref:Beta-carotene 3-hydroxylase n=1 Tax=Salvia divinorum TaxID=28513 RepID=A0ABD1I6A0_SALDI
MAAEISFSTTPQSILSSRHNAFLGPRPALQIPPSLHKIHGILRRLNLTVCFVLEDEKLRGTREPEDEEESGEVERAIYHSFISLN